jgi:hypothetical protein
VNASNSFWDVVVTVVLLIEEEGRGEEEDLYIHKMKEQVFKIFVTVMREFTVGRWV